MNVIENNKNLSDYHKSLMITSDWAIFDNLNNKYPTLDDLTYHINEYDHKYAYKNWASSLDIQLINYDSNILLINDGDQIFYNAYKLPCIATIVDPLAYVFTKPEYKKYLCTTEFLNTVDSLGHKRKLTLIDSTFKEALEDGSFKTKYSLIFLNIKKKEDAYIKNIEQIFLLLEDYGFFCIQINNKHLNQTLKNALEHYFTSIATKHKTTSLSESHSFLVLRKIPNLI